MYKTNIKTLKNEINNNSKYTKYLKVIDKFLSDNDISKLPNGIMNIDDNNYVVITGYENGEDNVVEAHKKYIDGHYIISGDEQLHVGYTDSLEETNPYNEEDDAVLYSGTLEHNLNLLEGDILLLFPEDGHKTKIKFNNDEVKKMIFKLKI